MPEFLQDSQRWLALAAGLALVAWGIWCILTWVKGDWQRLRRWFER